MLQSFEEETHLKSQDDIKQWKAQWEASLQQWHSPYKVLVDCSQLKIDSSDLKKDLENMMKYFQGFFMRSIAGFGSTHNETLTTLPFEVFANEDLARDKLNIRKREKISRGSENFRSTIFVENHFQQQCVELSFTDPVKLDSKEKLEMLKSKLSNNLMQWHSPWNLLIDCHNLDYDPALTNSFNAMLTFFNGFFLRSTIGYQPHKKDLGYPFPVFRSRHKAAAELEATSAIAGNTANCSTRK